MYGYEIDTLTEFPWREPGEDLTQYFNYGFNEETWKEYCMLKPEGEKSLKAVV